MFERWSHGATADMDNFTWSSGSFSPLPSWPGSSGAYDQVPRDACSQHAPDICKACGIDCLIEMRGRRPAGNERRSNHGPTVSTAHQTPDSGYRHLSRRRGPD